MDEETGRRVRRNIAKIIRYDSLDFETRKVRRRSKTPRPPKPQKPPKQTVEQRFEISYKCPDEPTNFPENLLSLQTLMDMSLDELEDFNAVGPSGETFDFDYIIDGIRDTASEIEILDDDFDYINYDDRSAVQVSSDICQLPIPVATTSKPIYEMIMRNDTEGYFKYVAEKLKTEDEFCLDNLFGPLRRDYFNPLHIAAANNKSRFISDAIFNFKQLFRKITPEITESQIRLYDAIVGRWLKEDTTRERENPVQLAAENGHTNCVVLLLAKTKIKHLWHKRSRRCYMSYFEESQETFINQLAFFDAIHCLSDEQIKSLIEIYKENKPNEVPIILQDAVGEALSTGSFESARRLLAIWPTFDNKHEEENIYYEHLLGIEQRRTPNVGRCLTKVWTANERTYLPVQRMKPVEWALYHGYAQVFDEIPDIDKYTWDQYGYTPLSACCVSLNDNDLQDVIDRYEPESDKEDFFTFLYQLVIANRIEIYLRELTSVLRDDKTYDLRPQMGMEYGLADHVVLPLSGTLVANKDMWIIEKIREVYLHNRAHHNEKMMIEDVNRCYEYIEYFHFKFSQQIRLAVILMLLHLTPIQNERWQEIMRRNQGYDRLTKYVLENYSSPSVCCREPLYTWSEALLKASEVVSKWNGTKEESNNVTNLKNAKISGRVKMEIDENSLKGILKKPVIIIV